MFVWFSQMGRLQMPSVRRSRRPGAQLDGPKCRMCGKPLPEEETQFLAAVKAGDCDDIKARLAANPGLALVKYASGNTPPHVAAEMDYAPVAQLLGGAQQ